RRIGERSSRSSRTASRGAKRSPATSARSSGLRPRLPAGAFAQPRPKDGRDKRRLIGADIPLGQGCRDVTMTLRRCSAVLAEPILATLLPVTPGWQACGGLSVAKRFGSLLASLLNVES